MIGSLAPQDMTPPRNPFAGTKRTGLAFQRSKSGPQNYGQSSGNFSAAKNRLLGGQPNTLPGVPAEKPQEQNS